MYKKIVCTEKKISTKSPADEKSSRRKVLSTKSTRRRKVLSTNSPYTRSNKWLNSLCFSQSHSDLR